jgi:hypothetical protein
MIEDDDIEAGTGWHHRIDAVPKIGRIVIIKTKGGAEHAARVVEAHRLQTFRGIGSEVSYSLGHGLKVSPADVTHWRYREQGK